MAPQRLLILTLIALLAAWPLPGAIAQEATPLASPVPATEPLDLAAMALDRTDLPPGYRQLQYDDEGYTPGPRVATIQFAGAIPDETIAGTGLAWFYSSSFHAEDHSGFIHVYLEEYPSEEAVSAGFALFEDEQRMTPENQTDDLPGPVAGQDPKETTVGAWTVPDDPSQSANFVDASFRVGRVRAGVLVETYGEAPPPDPALVEELAATLAGRVDAVLAGQAPPGIDLALPTRMLPLFETWPWPGNSLEGYKSADEFLGTSGSPPRFAADYQAGYARFASVESVPEVMVHTPPYITVEVAEFASPEAARGVLDVAEELPPRHEGPLPPSRTVAPSLAIGGVDQVRAFHTSREGLGEPPLPPLPGYELLFALDNQLVIINVEVDDPDRPAALTQAEAIALGLAAQQIACLGADEPCGPVQVPAALALSATPTPGTPTP